MVYARWSRPHRTEQVFRILDEYFGNRVIALEYPKFTGAGMDWPPYSPDLTPSGWRRAADGYGFERQPRRSDGGWRTLDDRVVGVVTSQ
ncbi:uncharacterized protein TNCV_3569301 [Trichonephila clavipes]|nr:uncharacterized protein TNCV_3569301 [Trichonephila clavipes]